MAINSSAPRRRPDDDTTRVIPAVPNGMPNRAPNGVPNRAPNAVPGLDQTQAIPPVPVAAGRYGQRAGNATDQTAVIPVVAPGGDATEVIPAVAPDRPGGGGDGTRSIGPARRFRRKDDTGFLLLGRVRAYDSKPGAEGYRGRHGDIIPLAEASPARKIFHVIGEVMITFGLVLLLFAGYEIWGKAAIVEGHQADLDAQLEQDWGGTVIVPPVDPSASSSPTQAPPPIPPGGTLGRLYLPRLDKYWVVVEGIEPQDIEYAPGHYPDSAQPGEIGNFSVAGHRSPAIFWDLDQMRAGDAVVVETRTTFFIYRVTSLAIVAPTAVEVVAPVPGQPGAVPSDAMLTLTTCNPKWDNYQRLILHATLDHSMPRSAGRPSELGG